MSFTTNFIDPTAEIHLTSRVWHFAVVLRDVRIGANCSIGSHTEIGVGTTIEEGSRIGYGCFFPSHSKIGKNVFVGPGVICCDDKHPVVDNPNYHAQPPIIEDDVSIGAGVILLPGIRVGKGALIGAGAVVTHNVKEKDIVWGVPAK